MTARPRSKIDHDRMVFTLRRMAMIHEANARAFLIGGQAEQASIHADHAKECARAADGKSNRFDWAGERKDFQYADQEAA